MAGMSKVTAEMKGDILHYSQWMSLESAAAKVKRSHLGRLDSFVDEAMRQIKAEKNA